MPCPKCGGMVQIDCNGHLEQIHCLNCDWKQAATAYPGEEMTLHEGGGDPVMVHVVWPEKAKARHDIIMLRELLGETNRIPLSVLLKSINSENLFFLGFYRKSTAITLQEKAKSKNLSLSITPVNPI